jgi:hypothetical protein
MSQVKQLPNTSLNLISLSLQTINGNDVFDDAGLPYVYGASKLLDMLEYGSFLAPSNTAKAVKTAAETNGIRINNKIAESTADSLTRVICPR